MKKTTFFLLLMISGLKSFSQKQIHSFIADNYELDAKVLAMREILSNPQDPDYNNPFLPPERYLPYMERLSDLYENPHNNPVVDSIFNEFKFHVNQAYDNPIGFKKIIIKVDNAAPWKENFKNTGSSGLSVLDGLMTKYQLSIFQSYEFPSCSCTYFILETNFDFLNMYALVDDFEAILDIENAEVQQADMAMELNYTGAPYFISTEPVEACDIAVIGDSFVFTLYSKDEFRVVKLNEDEENVPSASRGFENMSVYPNPAADYIIISGVSSEMESVKIFSVQGQLMKDIENISSEIDVSYLKTGIYIIQLISSEGKATSLKFIKK